MATGNSDAEREERIARELTVRYGLKAKLKVPRPVSKTQSPGAAESFKQTLDTRLPEALSSAL